MASDDILKGKKILIVDDEIDILETLKESLDMCDIETASNYDTAKELMESKPYEAVILDIMGVRGFDLLNAAVHLKFPTVMLTAHAFSPETLKKSIEMGARAYIPKEKMTEIVPFLEGVLTRGYRSGWRYVFDRLGGLFTTSFGANWQMREKDFWEKVGSGRYHPEPVILKK